MIAARRISTHTFGLRAASRLDNGAKLLDALRLPMMADVLHSLDGPRPLRAMLIAPFQVAKSASGQVNLARNLLVRPGPVLWYDPTKETAADFADLKLNPLLDAQPALTALVYPARNKTAKLRRAYAGGATILIRSHGNERDRHGVTARDIYIDELHSINESGAIKQIRNRHGSYDEAGEWLEYMMSTGLNAHTEAHNEWLTTDCCVWHVRCHSCQRLFEPRFSHHGDPTDPHRITGGLRYTRAFLDNGLPDERAIAATLVHECPHCHATLPDCPESRTALSGTGARPRGLYVATNTSPAPHSRGWTFHGLTVRPWLGMVVRFELAQLARKRGDLEPLAKCIREEFAGIWDPEHFMRETRHRSPSGYKLLEDWPDEGRDAKGRPLRFCSVDVQQDHYVVVIRKWNFRQRSRLHFCEKVTSPAQVELLATTHGVPPERVFLDSRHKPQEVRRLCARYGWRAVMGDPKVKDYPHPELDKWGKVIGRVRRIYSEPILLDPFQGLREQGISKVLEFHFSKYAALERLHLLRTLDTNEGPALWTDADDAPAWYAKEVNAFARILKTAADGSKFTEWIAGPDDHAADCEAIGIVAASIAGLVGQESLEQIPPSDSHEKPTQPS